MYDLELHNNFLRLKEWNGEDDLEDIIHSRNDIFGTKRCIEELNRDVYLRSHPLLVLFAQKGFRHVDIIRYGFNTNVNHLSTVMVKLLKNLTELDIINVDYISENNNNNNIKYSHNNVVQYDCDWLQKPLNDEHFQQTYGKVISILISSEGETTNEEHLVHNTSNLSSPTTTQLFIFLFFIDTIWYRQMRQGLSTGSIISKYKFFILFFKNCIDLDLFGFDNNYDLDVRADIIYDKYKLFTTNEDSCKEIILLDGHGRIFRRILERIINRMSELNTSHHILKVSELSFLVYDIDISNHLWHSYFFPHHSNHQTAIHGNTIDDDFYYSVVADNGIVYLNLSNIEGKEDKLVEFVSLFKTEQEKQRLVLSFPLNKFDNKSLHTVIPFLEEEVGMVRPQNYRNDVLTYYFH